MKESHWRRSNVRGGLPSVPLVTSDPIYGTVELPGWIRPLLTSAAIQRLRWIALSNVPSLSYPMIAGVSRYAHSLGVTLLADRISRRLGMEMDDRKTLVCAAMLHDAGIPPLGHLTEQSFELCGYPIDHEDALRSVILEQGRIFSQMPNGQKVGVSDALVRMDVDALEVFEAILGRNDVGRLLRSDMDIDNIDNVVRIFRLTGDDSGYDPYQLAMRFFLDGDGKAKNEWAEVRRRLYSRLMFSMPDFAMKATTKRYICSFLEKRLAEHRAGHLDDSTLLQQILFLHDSQLYELLAQECPASAAMSYGQFDRVVAKGWVDCGSDPVVRGLREAIDDVGEGYYFDHIPDKRVKDASGCFGSGALVGAFCVSSGSQEADIACASVFRNWRVASIDEDADSARPSIQPELF